MRKNTAIVIVLLLAFSMTIVAPAVASAASPLDNLMSPSGSSNGFLNIIIGLLLGKFFGNVSNSTLDTGKNSLASSSSGTGAATITPLPSGSAILDTAKKYMGTPYVWGAETPKDGFDCSGFTQYVMQQNDVKLPRTAAEQYATGTPVEKSQLKAGDLVFFTTYKAGASHVGFYMGDGNFIHASSAAKKVTINNLTETFYAEHYIGARRYI